MSDRQSKKRRLFRFRSNYNLQSGPNIDKKVQLFRRPLAFYPTMEDVCCPDSGTKQAQSWVRSEGKMNKRKLGGFALSAMLFALCPSAEAQQPKKVPRIGYQSASSSGENNEEAFRQGLRELGYIDGQNILIEWRFAQGKPDQVTHNVAELVRLKVDVIVTGGAADTYAAKAATSTIPIVMTNETDPVGRGIVASLSRP